MLRDGGVRVRVLWVPPARPPRPPAGAARLSNARLPSFLAVWCPGRTATRAHSCVGVFFLFCVWFDSIKAQAPLWVDWIAYEGAVGAKGGEEAPQVHMRTCCYGRRPHGVRHGLNWGGGRGDLVCLSWMHLWHLFLLSFKLYSCFSID